MSHVTCLFLGSFSVGCFTLSIETESPEPTLKTKIISGPTLFAPHPAVFGHKFAQILEQVWYGDCANI